MSRAKQRPSETRVLTPEVIQRTRQSMLARELVRELPAYEIVLRFRSEQDKSDWLAQMTDGYGENWQSLHWDWQHGEECDAAKVFDVELFEEDEND